MGCAFGCGVGGLGLLGRGLCWNPRWRLCWPILFAVGGFVHEGLGLVGWGWSVVVCAFGFGVGGLGLVGRGLCLQVWHGWVGVGQGWFVRWRWWVGVGRSGFVRDGFGLVGWAYVGPA